MGLVPRARAVKPRAFGVFEKETLGSAGRLTAGAQAGKAVVAGWRIASYLADLMALRLATRAF